MASTIWLGDLFGDQDYLTESIWNFELYSSERGSGDRAIIAKGNKIEGIEAKA